MRGVALPAIAFAAMVATPVRAQRTTADTWSQPFVGVQQLTRTEDAAGVRTRTHVLVVDLAQEGVQARMDAGSDTEQSAIEVFAPPAAPGHARLTLQGERAFVLGPDATGAGVGDGPRFVHAGAPRWQRSGPNDHVRINGATYPEEALTWDVGRQANLFAATANEGRYLLLGACEGRGAGQAAGCRLALDVPRLLAEVGRELGLSFDDAVRLDSGPGVRLRVGGRALLAPPSTEHARTPALVIRAPAAPHARPTTTRSERDDAGFVDAGVPDGSALPVEPAGCAAGGAGGRAGTLVLLALVAQRRRRRSASAKSSAAKGRSSTR